MHTTLAAGTDGHGRDPRPPPTNKPASRSGATSCIDPSFRLRFHQFHYMPPCLGSSSTAMHLPLPPAPCQPCHSTSVLMIPPAVEAGLSSEKSFLDHNRPWPVLEQDISNAPGTSARGCVVTAARTNAKNNSTRRRTGFVTATTAQARACTIQAPPAMSYKMAHIVYNSICAACA